MKASESKKNILGKIRRAYVQHRPAPPYPNLDTVSPIFRKDEDIEEFIFAKKFTKSGGKFAYVEDYTDFFEQVMELSFERGWNDIYCWDWEISDVFKEVDFRNIRIGQNLSEARVGIVKCDALIARTGSILFSLGLKSQLTLSSFPETLIVLAYTSQVVPDFNDGINLIKEKYFPNFPSMVWSVSGPSKNFVVENIEMMGLGQSEVFVFLVEDSVE